MNFLIRRPGGWHGLISDENHSVAKTALNSPQSKRFTWRGAAGVRYLLHRF